MFLTGINEFRAHDAWPPKDAKVESLHLGNRGRLSALPDISRDAVDSATPPPPFDEWLGALRLSEPFELTVVGVVPTGKYRRLGEDPLPYIYYAQEQLWNGAMVIHIRTDRDPLSLVPLLVVIIAMIGLIFGREAAQGRIADELGKVLGSQMADALQTMIAAAAKFNVERVRQEDVARIGGAPPGSSHRGSAPNTSAEARPRMPLKRSCVIIRSPSGASRHMRIFFPSASRTRALMYTCRNGTWPVKCVVIMIIRATQKKMMS